MSTAGETSAGGPAQGRAGTGRRRTEPAVWVALVALAAAFFVWRVVDNPRPGLHPPETSYDASEARVGRSYVYTNAIGTTTRNAAVRLPIGTEHIAVGRPTTGVETQDDDDVTPPAGGSFVSVLLTLDPSTATVPVDLLATHELTVTTAVLAGGRRYPLNLHGEITPDVVAVAGRPAEVSIEIGYGGVRQRVDMATGKVSATAAAAALYRRIPSGTQTCGPATLTKPYSSTASTYPLTCTLAWREVPYVPGRGWAKAGSGWVLLAVTTEGPGAVLRSGRRESVYAGQGLLGVTCGDGSAATDEDRDPSLRNRDAVSLFICPQAPGSITIAEELETFDRVPLRALWSARLH